MQLLQSTRRMPAIGLRIRIPRMQNTLASRHDTRQPVPQIAKHRSVQMEAELLALRPQLRQKPLQRTEVPQRHIDIDLHIIGEIDRAIRPLTNAEPMPPERRSSNSRQRIRPHARAAHRLLRQRNAERVEQPPAGRARRDDHPLRADRAALGDDARHRTCRPLDAHHAAALEESRAPFHGARRERGRRAARFGLAVARRVQAAQRLALHAPHMLVDLRPIERARVQSVLFRNVQPLLERCPVLVIVRDVQTAALPPLEIEIQLAFQLLPDAHARHH